MPNYDEFDLDIQRTIGSNEGIAPASAWPCGPTLERSICGTRGQRIGLSGNSGNVVGNGHLHFELSNSTRDRMADFFPGR